MTDQPKTAAQWADEFYAGDDCHLGALFAAAMAQARETALTEATAAVHTRARGRADEKTRFAMYDACNIIEAFLRAQAAAE